MRRARSLLVAALVLPIFALHEPGREPTARASAFADPLVAPPPFPHVAPRVSDDGIGEVTARLGPVVEPDPLDKPDAPTHGSSWGPWWPAPLPPEHASPTPPPPVDEVEEGETPAPEPEPVPLPGPSPEPAPEPSPSPAPEPDAPSLRVCLLVCVELRF